MFFLIIMECKGLANELVLKLNLKMLNLMLFFRRSIKQF